MVGSAPRLGILASGRGSNLGAILAAIDERRLPAEVVLVAGNRLAAPALQRAAERGLPILAAARSEYPSRAAQQQVIAAALRDRRVDYVVLAGFDQILVPEFIQAFPLRIVNVHPSLLPAFAGTLHAAADAWTHGVKIAGCTVHFVTSDVDAGPIILQAAVPVHDDDTAESLAARILEEEHRILPEALRLLAEGRLRVEGRWVRGTGPRPPAEGSNPCAR